MPSSKDPLSSIQPGPGKLPAGVVNASAFIVPGGGGGGGSSAALLAHINDPVDAHMASAIGVNQVDPTTGQSVLSVVGGPVDGESVLDFIVQAKDLFPVRPDRLGFEAFGLPNTGVMRWNQWMNTFVKDGAWTNGAAAVFSHFILPATGATAVPTGLVYPGDRGVLAVYRSTDGNYNNPGTTTLYAALWLGPTATKPAGLTCPSANFVETSKTGLQANYVATNVGLDRVSLSNRLPYLKDYSTYGSPYADYALDFFAYQIATFLVSMPAVVNGSNDSWLIIHWHETYAVNDAAIAPAAIALNYTSNNAYSAVPPDYDANPSLGGEGVQFNNRRYVYKDTLSATVPTVASWTASVIGVPSTIFLSGVAAYDNGTTPLTWNSDLRVNSLVANGWLPGKTSGAQLPADFVTTADPIEFNFADFGGSISGRAYYQLRPTGGALYTIAAAPVPADQVQDVTPVLAITTPVPYTPPAGNARIRVNMNRPWATDDDAQATRWLFNSWPQGIGSSATDTFEPFRDERYRYDHTFIPVSTMRILPVGPGVKYDSTVVLTSGAVGPLQVIGDAARYPQLDYSTGHSPVGPDYAAVLAGDPGNAIRIYTRAFNTGIARRTGRFRIRGVPFSAFQAGPYTGDPLVDHPGGMGFLVSVPGSTNTLDLGRPFGDPDVDMSQSYRGVMTAVSVSGADTFVDFDTQAFTGDNGFGEFPLYITLVLLKGSGGVALSVEEIEWLPPL